MVVINITKYYQTDDPYEIPRVSLIWDMPIGIKTQQFIRGVNAQIGVPIRRNQIQTQEERKTNIIKCAIYYPELPLMVLNPLIGGITEDIKFYYPGMQVQTDIRIVNKKARETRGRTPK